MEEGWRTHTNIFWANKAHKRQRRKSMVNTHTQTRSHMPNTNKTSTSLLMVSKTYFYYFFFTSFLMHEITKISCWLILKFIYVWRLHQLLIGNWWFVLIQKKKIWLYIDSGCHWLPPNRIQSNAATKSLHKSKFRIIQLIAGTLKCRILPTNNLCFDFFNLLSCTLIDWHPKQKNEIHNLVERGKKNSLSNARNWSAPAIEYHLFKMCWNNFSKLRGIKFVSNSKIRSCWSGVAVQFNVWTTTEMRIQPATWWVLT